MPYDSFRHAAHQSMENRASTLRSHNDQIDVIFICDFENLCMWSAPLRRRYGVEFRPFLGCEHRLQLFAGLSLELFANGEYRANVVRLPETG